MYGDLHCYSRIEFIGKNNDKIEELGFIESHDYKHARKAWMSQGETVTKYEEYKEELEENEIVVGVIINSDRFNRPVNIQFLILDIY